MASKFLNLSLDNTLGGDNPSDYKIPSERAIKTYVDNVKQSIEVMSDTNGEVILTMNGLQATDDISGNVSLKGI